MSWRAAKSIDKLRKQINALYPNRDKKSDGIVGDTSHKARKSSHNPDKRGAVRAWDCTHNIEQGVDCREFLKALLKNPDKRLWYIIFNSKIYNVKDGFQPRPYSGLNAHKHHLHISVSDNPDLYDNDSDWILNFSEIPNNSTNQPTQPTISAVSKPSEIGLGAKGDNVKAIQIALVAHGFLAQSQCDGLFGKKTEQALQRFQHANNLIADGICGANTRKALGI